MGKIITATPDVKSEIETPKGEATYSESFFGFLIDAMNKKGPVDTLERIDISIGIVRQLRKAKEEKAATITLENEEFKILDAAAKACLPGTYPALARELRVFFRALESKTEKNPDGVQDVDLSTKK
jgi:hypothetical protein